MIIAQNRFIRGLLILLTALACLFPNFTIARSLYVDLFATGPTDGLTWCTAYYTLYDALAVALPGDTIFVADGIQIPNTLGLPDPRDATFQLMDDVTIMGGYPGCNPPTSLSLSMRNPSVYRTVLSGDLLGDDTTGGSNAENVYHVVTGSGTSASAVLDGVVVRSGNANNVLGFRDHGGGLYNDAGSPTIQGCLFFINHADLAGGGMCNQNGSSPAVTSCIFRQNGATDGGGMCNFANSNPILWGCNFIQNYAENMGGAIANHNSRPYLIDCLLYNNQATNGGGIRNSETILLFAINCAFYGNRATNSFGGVGGAVSNDNAIFSGYINCLFSGNRAWHGGALHNNNLSSPIFKNCTIANNTVVLSGGGICQAASGGNPYLGNSILWDNSSDTTGSGVTAQIYVGGGSPTIDQSCVMGTWTGAGVNNIDTDPQFVDAIGPDAIIGTPDDDLELSPGSPCIDSGDDTLVPNDGMDLDDDGNTSEPTPYDLSMDPRFLDDSGTSDTGIDAYPYDDVIVDRGCYEFTGVTPPTISWSGYNELPGGESHVEGAVTVDDFFYAAGWSIDGDGLPQPVLWSDAAKSGQVTVLPTSERGGRVNGLTVGTQGEPPTAVGARFGPNSLPRPAVWTFNGSAYQLVTLPDVGFLTGQASDGLYTFAGDLLVSSDVLDQSGIWIGGVWVRNQVDVWSYAQLPGYGNNLATSAAAVAQSPTTGDIVVVGAAADDAGNVQPAIWISAPGPELDWEMVMLDSCDAFGAAKGITFGTEGNIAIVGQCQDELGQVGASVWYGADFDYLTPSPLPPLPGFQHGEAVAVHLQHDGTLHILGRSYDTTSESVATLWTLDPQGQAQVENLNELQSDWPIDSINATDYLANFNGEIFAIVGNGVYEGADKSMLESHAFMLRYVSVTTPVTEGESPPQANVPVLNAFPNPFNPSTMITCELSNPGQVEVGIYDLLGRRVAVLLSGAISWRRVEIVWDGRDDSGRSVGSGTYFVRAVSREGTATRKVLLLK